MMNCIYCGETHGVRCPWVRAIEYDPTTGRVKRVEFFEHRAPSIPVRALQPAPIRTDAVGKTLIPTRDDSWAWYG